MRYLTADGCFGKACSGAAQTSQSLDTATSTSQAHREIPSSGSSSASLARRGTTASTSNATVDNAYLAHRYTSRLGKVKLGAASIGFRRLEDLDLVVLTELVTEANYLTPPDPVG